MRWKSPPLAYLRPGGELCSRLPTEVTGPPPWPLVGTVRGEESLSDASTVLLAGGGTVGLTGQSARPCFRSFSHRGQECFCDRDSLEPEVGRLGLVDKVSAERCPDSASGFGRFNQP